MPQIEYFVVAESMALDKDRNTVSLFHVIERLAGSPPLLIPALVAVSYWKIAEEETGRDFQAALRIHLPGGQALPDEFQENTINFTPHERRFRTHHFVKGLRIDHFGDVTFEMLLNGNHAAEHVVNVEPADQ